MNEIESLRQALRKGIDAFKKQSTLLTQRENLFNRLESEPHLKKQLIELDHFLDEIEGDLQNNTETLKEKIALEIIKKSPETKITYETFQKNIYEGNANIKHTDRYLQLSQQLIQLFEAALAARQAIKRRGILSYIFGINPNMAISQHLKAAELLIEKFETPAPKEQTFIEFKRLLLRIQKECGEKWGFSKIDITLPKNIQHLKDYQIKFQEIQTEKQKKLQEMNQQLNEWLFNG